MKKHIFNFSLWLILIFSIVGCSDGDCTFCLNGGTPLDNGQCNCPNGYTGTYCEDETREEFVGFYFGTTKFNNQSTKRTLNLTKSQEDVLSLLLDGTATVRLEGDTLRITQQEIVDYQSGTSIEISDGIGFFTNDSLVFEYSLTYQGNTNRYSFVGAKR